MIHRKDRDGLEGLKQTGDALKKNAKEKFINAYFNVGHVQKIGILKGALKERNRDKK